MKNFYLIGLLISCVTACGKKEKTVIGTSGQAKVEFSNSTTLRLANDATRYTPSQFAFKLMNVYIVPDVTESNKDNVGVASMIWINPDCTTKDSESESGKKDKDGNKIMYKYKVMDSCEEEKISKKFEIARSATEVNADLNSKNYPVLPGTYNYVKLDICIGGPKGNNATFKADGMIDSAEIKLGTCGVTSAKLATPMTIEEGESVIVSLQYDLANLVYDYGEGMSKSDNCYFNESGTVRRCVDFPNLVPSAKKQ